MKLHVAEVKNGRLVLDEPTDLPEGTRLELVVAEERQRFLDEVRRRIVEGEAHLEDDLPHDEVIADARASIPKVDEP